MKIGELSSLINKVISEKYPDIPATEYISPTKINGFRKQGFIVPEVGKKDNQSFFDFRDIHYELILNAYIKTIVNKTRTRNAFEQAREELASPLLF